MARKMPARGPARLSGLNHGVARAAMCATEDIAHWHPELFLEPHTVACVAVLRQYSESPALFDGGMR